MEEREYTPEVFDIDLLGNTQSGNLKEIYDYEALNNSLKLWIASYRGDYIGMETMGGYVTESLNRPMRDIDIIDVKQAITVGLKNDFKPKLEIISLAVEPDYRKRRWRIMLDAYAPSVNIRVRIDENIKDLSS